MMESTQIIRARFVLLFSIGSEQNPVPNIKANGSDGSIEVSADRTVSLSISVNAGSHANEVADWWVLQLTPDGNLYYFDLSTLSMKEGYAPTLQSGLVSFGDIQILSLSGLQEGTHVFYFGIDLTVNGVLDVDSLYYDYVQVNTLPSEEPNLVINGKAFWGDGSPITGTPAKGKLRVGIFNQCPFSSSSITPLTSSEITNGSYSISYYYDKSQFPLSDTINITSSVPDKTMIYVAHWWDLNDNGILELDEDSVSENDTNGNLYYRNGTSWLRFCCICPDQYCFPPVYQCDYGGFKFSCGEGVKFSYDIDFGTPW